MSTEKTSSAKDLTSKSEPHEAREARDKFVKTLIKLAECVGVKLEIVEKHEKYNPAGFASVAPSLGQLFGEMLGRMRQPLDIEKIERETDAIRGPRRPDASNPAPSVDGGT